MKNVIFILMAAALTHAQSTVTNLQSIAVPRLAGLPSAEGPTVAQIRAMGDNTWLNLGSPAADPVWGRRRGASWTPKMAYASDLRGAFVYGSGQHGGTAIGYYLDDLWVYDINGHKWVCAWPGTKTTWVLQMSASGIEVDSTGMPVPVARIVHGYCLESYDSDLKKFIFMITDDPYWGNSLPLRWNWIPSTSMYWSDGKFRCPFLYDVTTGKWERKFPATGTEMDAGRLESMVEYIPTLKKTFHLRYANVWLFDYTANAWTKIAAPGAPAFGGYDGVMCYDSKRDRVYVGKGTEFKAFDVQARTWSAPVQANVGSGIGASMTYDSVNDVVLSNIYPTAYSSTKEVKVYSPSTDRWTTVSTVMPLANNLQLNAFYDPVLNVHFFFGAGDSYDNGVMLAYRYKKGGGSGAEWRTSWRGEGFDLRISPNPVHGHAVVWVVGAAGSPADEPLTAGVYDLRGRLVSRLSNGEWDASTVPDGVYLLRFKTGSGFLSKRVLVQK